MNIYTVMGAALTSREIRKLWFKDPKEAAKKLGIVLSNNEEKTLSDISKRGDGDLQQRFRELAIIVCPQRPCMLAPVSVLDKDSKEDPNAQTDNDPDLPENASMTSAAD